MSMQYLCAWCSPPTSLEGGISHGICWRCAEKHFPGELEGIRRNCKHDYELENREHQTDSYPVSMTDTVIRSKIEVSHFDTLICRLCGDKWETAGPCECS